jgi:hypothetical protein
MSKVNFVLIEICGLTPEEKEKKINDIIQYSMITNIKQVIEINGDVGIFYEMEEA